MSDLYLRDVREDDLPIFFEHQQDRDAIYLAAFTAKDPADRKAFENHWHRNLADPTVIVRTIVCDGEVAGHVLSYEESAGMPEVSYWIGRSYWGRGIATQALTLFLTHVHTVRPIFARVATDNLGSRRVLAKCGFEVTGAARGYANARGEEIDELELTLT